MKRPHHTAYHAPLAEGQFYHIFNRSINKESIFFKERNCEFFLRKFHQYFDPYVETWAWVLMRNHFHWLIKIRQVDTFFLEAIEKESTNRAKRFLEDRDLNFFLEGQFKRLFSSYALAFNKEHERTGSLFQKRFRRLKLETDMDVYRTLDYIHHNPVKHGFVDEPREWKFSSFRDYEKENAIFIPWN
jgi:REP element-mobilizing transposase RayT